MSTHLPFKTDFAVLSRLSSIVSYQDAFQRRSRSIFDRICCLLCPNPQPTFAQLDQVAFSARLHLRSLPMLLRRHSTLRTLGPFSVLFNLLEWRKFCTKWSSFDPTFPPGTRTRSTWRTPSTMPIDIWASCRSMSTFHLLSRF